MPPVSLRSILPISAKGRTEADRIEPILLDSLASPLSLERRRMESRVLGVAKDDTEGMVAVLLHHTEAKHENARESIFRLLDEISQTREGKAAILENLSHPDQEVRKGVRTMMVRIWGEGTDSFAADYEQALLLMNLARSRDIFVDDIVTLAELVKVTLLEGDRDKALEDIALVAELLKHRYRAVETMKNYLADMLKITPELSKLGMMSGRIEESLRVASRANKQRSFNYTKDLIDEKMREVETIDQLRSLGVSVRELLSEAPHVPLEKLSGMDVWMISRLKELVTEGTNLNVTARRSELIDLVGSFLQGEVFPYLRDKAQDRLSARDPSLLFALYTVGLTCLKLLHEPLPKVAEELYVTYFRDLEGVQTVKDVSWPSAVM
ncbi:MAG: hypothetical protein A4E30_01668 [Methanomassiliicoccales archaeon PtaB.Bin215]|nr:MAG: hypothetical protein A4E30_01668 [Methanomassiliicoccales archaeon PtaB.Bin215]